MASTKFEVSMEIFKFQGEPDVSVTLTGKSPTELETALKTLETIAKTTTMYDINPLSNVSDVLTAFCGMPYGTQPETEEWRAAVYRFSRFMNWTTPERFIPVTEIRREQPNMENPIFTFMGVPITEDSASKLKEAMKKCGVSALEAAGVCERFAKIARATLDELPDGNKEEEHDD